MRDSIQVVIDKSAQVSSVIASDHFYKPSRHLPTTSMLRQPLASDIP